MKKAILGFVILGLPVLVYLCFNKQFGLIGVIACSRMTSVDQIKIVMKTHNDVISKIERIREDKTIQVTYETPYNKICPDKGRLLIMYPSEQDRVLIQKTIKTDTFFGVPYNWRNI